MIRRTKEVQKILTDIDHLVQAAGVKAVSLSPENFNLLLDNISPGNFQEICHAKGEIPYKDITIKRIRIKYARAQDEAKV